MISGLQPGAAGVGPSGLRLEARKVLQLIAFGILVTTVCWAAIEVPRDIGRPAPIWLTNALVLTVLLISPPRRWAPWLAVAFLGNTAASLISGGALPLSLILSVCNSLEVTLAALLLRRVVGPEFDPSRLRDLVAFFLIAGLASPLLAASLAALASGQFGRAGSLADLATWAAADGLGTMIVTPLLLSLRGARRRLADTPMRPIGWLALAVVVATTALVFLTRQPIFFLIPPAMLLAVFELEVVGAALSVLIVVAVGALASALGYQPMAALHLSLSDRLIVGQVFLAAITLTSFPTAAALAQRRRFKAELDEQYRRVKLAEEIAGVGYWRAANGDDRMECSVAVLDALGFPHGAAPTRVAVLAAVHPDDRAEVARLIRDARDLGEEHGVQCRVVRPDGEVRHILAKACCDRGPNGASVGVFGTMFDVTELRRAQDEVVAREARYRLLADAATDVVLKVDRNDVINYVSPSARRYGYEPDELLGVTGYALVHPDDLAKVQAIMADLFATGEADTTRDRTYRVRAADGSYVWMEGNPAIIRDEEGNPRAVVSQLRDITQRMALEADLRAAREGAEAAAAVKADFLANMSHELRTPLTSVLGFTRLALEQPELTEVTRGYIAKASNAGAALLTTVNDILDFSRLESGRLQIRPAPCDVDELCRSTLELFSASAEAKGVTLRYDARDLPPHLSVDPDRVRQVLLNLLGNAVKFSDEGEVRLSVGWRARDSHLVVSVEDDGPGVAPDQQSLLFRRFSQVDGSATRRHGGTGLGLAICLGLVETMGGAIGVESEPGQGARFSFDLPAEPCEPAAAQTLELTAFAAGVRVLVADDHAVNRELVRAILAPLGAEVFEAGNGMEAVAAAAGSVFDIILMDLRMPELDGLSAMTAIRAGDGPNRDAPILAFSAGADAPGAEERRRAGFDGDLAKPLLPADLIAAVALNARADAGRARPASRARKGSGRKTRAATPARVAGTKS